jgi:hypothetical protein
MNQPAGLLTALRTGAAQEGAALRIMADDGRRAAVALHSQPLELPWLREFVRTQLGDGAYPHLVLRVRLVTQAAVSVRRDPDEVLLEEAFR